MARSTQLALVWTLPTVLFVALVALTERAVAIAPPQQLGAEDRACAMGALRGTLGGNRGASCTSTTPASLVAVTVWSAGRALVRIDGTGTSLGAATADAATRLGAAVPIRMMSPEQRAAARIQVDVIGARAPLGAWLVHELAMPGIADIAALDAGIDGIGADVDGHPVLLLPNEVISAHLAKAMRASDKLPEIATGADVSRVVHALEGRTHTRAPIPISSMWRFRTDAFVEAPAGPPVPLVRGVPPAPELSSAALTAAVLGGARYLVNHLAPNGRFLYEHDLVTGHTTDVQSRDYSMPRHGGTTYFLAQVYRITKATWLKEPIERSFAYLVSLMNDGRCATTLPDGTAIDCVLDRGQDVAHLGSTALVVVALAEYQRATGDARYLPLATKLAAFLLYMQRPDGTFRYHYDRRTHVPDETAQELYYAGESSLALARMFVVTGDRRYADAAARGIDALIGWYDFFLGAFFYGEEHWTCIAAEALWPAVQKPAYDDFCRGYGAFLRQEQLPDGDLAGAYSATPFLVPSNTPTGSRTEAMIAAYLLGVDHGDPDPAIRGQVRAALQYALGQQIGPESDFSAAGSADGGIPGSALERTVRIDYVQHTCSAMLRAVESGVVQ